MSNSTLIKYLAQDTANKIVEQQKQKLQAEYNAWKQQQDGIAALQAEYDAWSAANSPQPTVRTSAPKQTIPYLTDHQNYVNKAIEERTRLAELDRQRIAEEKAKEDTAAMVDDITRKISENVLPKEKKEEQKVRKNSGLEDYFRQQQEENMLASDSTKRSKEEIAKNIVENNTHKRFNPNVDLQNNANNYKKDILGGINVSEQPQTNTKSEIEELAEIFKASMKDYAPKFTYRGKKWNNPYDSLSEEQKQAVKDYIIENQNRTDLSKEEREILNAFNKAYLNSNDPKDANYNGLSASLNSKDNLGRALQAGAAGFVDFNMPFAEAVTKGVSKLPALNENEINKNIEDTRNYIEQSKALNPKASETGRSAGQIYDYAVTAPLVGGVAAAAGLGKAGTIALNQALQAVQDVGLDIYPEAQRMLREEGKINWGELAKRGLTDVAQNGFMEAIPYLGALNYDSLVKTVGNNADIFKNIDATGALKNVPDAARSIADALDRSGKVPFVKPSGVDEVDSIVGNATKQAEEAVQNIGDIANQIPKVEDAAKQAAIKAAFDNAPRYRVGKATTLIGDYDGPKPEKIVNNTKRVDILDDYFDKAVDDIVDAKKKATDKLKEETILTKVYKSLFGGGKETQLNYPVNGLVFDGDPYTITVNKNVVGKVMSDGALTPEKIAVLQDIENVIKNADYVGTAPKFDYKGNGGKPDVIRYDYFETPVRIKGHDYLASFDVEVYPFSNKYRTHRVINELNLSLATEEAAKATATEVHASPINSGNLPGASKGASGLSSNPNITDAIKNVNENSIKNNGINNVVEDATKNQFPEYPEDVQEKVFSDFEEIYRGMDNMNQAAIDSGSEKALEKFEKLQKLVFDYEEKIWKSTDPEEINNAKKAADAARQSFIREMKKVDPNYKGDLTGTKLGNAQYRIPKGVSDEEAKDLVNGWVKEEMDNPNRFAEDVSKRNSKVATKGANTKEYSIQELNRKGGKKGYYVAESAGNGTTRNVEPGKVYKSKEEAEKVLSKYKLQTFADGDQPKEKWKTSKFYTNTADKKGWADNLDEADYGYRATNAQEQQEVFNGRYKDSKDVVRDLVELDQFDDADMRGAMSTMDDLMNGSIDDIRKGSRLGKKISFEGREGGRVVQAMHDAKLNTPSGQLRQAQQSIGDAIDKRVGKGTTEALDNLYEKVYQAYDKASDKEEFAKKLEELLSGDLKKYASKKTAVDMDSKNIRGLNKIIKMLDKAESLEDVPIDDLMDIMYKANGGLTLSPKAQKEIYDLLKEASQYDPNSYEFRVLQGKAARKVMAEVPAGLGDYIRTFLYDNMLGNFKTAFSRNFMGNVAYQSLEKLREPVSAGIDALTSKVTGKRSALGWNKGKAGSYIQGFKKGGQETLGDIANGVNTTRSGQTGWQEALKNNVTVHNDNKKLGHWANQVDFYVENAMKGGDRPIYEANYAEFKTELEQLLQRYGKDRVAGLESIDDADLPEVIDKIASVRAADEVFQKKGNMSEGLTKLRDGLGDLSRGTFGVDILSTASSPFTLTPGNMLERALEYTPVGAIKNAAETLKEVKAGNFNQRRFVDEAGRTVTGIPVLLAAYAGAKKGLINGGYSTDPDEKQAQIDDGFIEYGLNVPERIPVFGGKTYDTSDLPVYGPFMQAGSVIAEEGLSPKSGLQAAEAVAGGSAMQGIRRAFGADNASYSSQNGVVENLADTVKSSGTQFIPSLLRQTAQTSDKYKRDLGEYGTNEYYINSIKNSLPWLRETLPIKTDIEGQPVLQNQGRGIGSKILENYVLPMNVSEYEPSELNQEATRLLKEGAGNVAFVPKAKRSDLRGWDDKAQIEYSEEQFRNYKQDLGTLNSEVGHAVIESNFYKELDDSKKATTLESVYKAMKAIAKENATGLGSDDKIAAAYKDGGTEGMLNYLAGKDATKEAGYTTNSNVGKAINELAESGDTEAAYDLSSQLKLLPDYGLDHKGPDATYTKVYEAYNGITAEEFAKTYKTIDKDHNQALKKNDELIPYMNSQHMSYDEGMKFFNAYGNKNWKLPKLENGTWK